MQLQAAKAYLLNKRRKVNASSSLTLCNSASVYSRYASFLLLLEQIATHLVPKTIHVDYLTVWKPAVQSSSHWVEIQRSAAQCSSQRSLGEGISLPSPVLRILRVLAPVLLSFQSQQWNIFKYLSL